MKIIAKIQIRTNQKHHWKLGDKEIFERCIESLSKTRIIDYVYVWTNDEIIIKKYKTRDASNLLQVFERPLDMIHYGNSLTTVNDWHATFDGHIKSHLGMNYEHIAIIFHVNINLALITPNTYKAMYHQLMEDDKANGIFPVVKVKPHLYMQNHLTGYLFPIWEQQGLDRQKYPQLYRKLGSWVEHVKRPKIAGVNRILQHEVLPSEAIDIETKQDLEMANYFIERRQGK